MSTFVLPDRRHDERAPDELFARLTQRLPPGRAVRDADVLAAYSRDHAPNAEHAAPAALVRVRSADEVATVVGICSELGVPVVARGAGTGLSGGANSVAGCVVVSFEAMNQILRIDPDERLAVVQPGVVNDDLRRACAEQGLWYPPDPASAAWSTLGGNAATNAGGLCCVKYGVTREYVLGLQAVVGTGDLVRLGRATAKGVAGYDLVGLLVGSEGTLGLITELTLRLRPARAQEHTVVAYFADLAAAGRAVAAVTRAGLVPSALELMDRYCLEAVDEWKGMGLVAQGEVLLLARTDATGQAADVEADALLQVLQDAGAGWAARSSDAAEAEALFDARRLVYRALERRGPVITEDVCVPRTAVAPMMAAIDDIAQRHRLRIASLAHAGDGNLHPMIVLDGEGDGDRVRAAAAMEQIVDTALDLGGTVSGEHGIGLLKRAGLVRELDPVAMAMHRAVKAALDPAGIFNPGKVFAADTTQEPR